MSAARYDLTPLGWAALGRTGPTLRATYRVLAPIPSLGAEPGDRVLVELAHPAAPLRVVRDFDRNRLPIVLDHIDQELELIIPNCPERGGAAEPPEAT